MTLRFILGASAVCFGLGCGRVASLGEELPQTGGTSGTGGTGGTSGGSGSGGSGGAVAEPLPYPLAPSVPIDLDCACPNENQVCNADAECVPRCYDGACAVWPVERAVADLFLDGNSLFFLLSPERDLLGNAAGAGSLWKAECPGGAPVKIADVANARSGYGKILGRQDGITYVWAQTLVAGMDSIISVTDDGTVAALSVPADFSTAPTKVVLGTGSLFFATPSGIHQRALTPNAVIEHRVQRELSSFDLVLANKLWFRPSEELCSFDPSDAAAAPTCAPFAAGDSLFAATGDYALLSAGIEIRLIDEAGMLVKRLYSSGATAVLHAGSDVMHGEFLYGLLSDFTDPTPYHLVRYRTDSAVTPVDVLPPQVVSVANMAQPDLGYAYAEAFRYVAAETGIFWTQDFSDTSTNGGNLSRYVFHRALPE